ncbi:MAG: NAD(P)/FAD-dependent oxidoreductase [Deltaproteobacteria bacterium]|nr:NAD(P)/FAD-dependent oxidoreductase [Deltaproteobacteria bacterium]
MSTVYDVAVIGGGIGGAAAALRAAQHNLRVAWLLGDEATAKASRAKYVYTVDNMVGVHPAITQKKLAAVLSAPEHAAARKLVEEAHLHLGTQDIVDEVVERLAAQFERADILRQRVTSAARAGEEFLLATAGEEVRARHVVLSTGVMDRQPRVKVTTKGGKVIDDVNWVYPYANNETLLYCVICEGHLTREAPTVVFGASEAAAQVALMLHERYGTRVSLLTNGEPVAASGDSRRLFELYGIAVSEERVVEILDGGAKPRGASLRGFRLEGGRSVEARFALVTMGLHRVYNELAAQLGAELDERDGALETRHVLVDEATSETSVRGLFAVGDMSRRRGSAPSFKQIYTAQEFAVRAVQTVDRRVRAARRAELLAASAAPST